VFDCPKEVVHNKKGVRKTAKREKTDRFVKLWGGEGGKNSSASYV